MRDTDLFQTALGIKEPWYVDRIEFLEVEKRIDIYLDFRKGGRFQCPMCGAEVKAYDTTDKEWRHLNFFQHEAYLKARVPRIECSEHGIKQVELPWTRQMSGFTLLFEAFIMALAKSMPVTAIGRLLNETDPKIWRVVEHYVDNAIEGQDLSELKKIGVDETASKRGHNYVTLFVDLEEKKAVYVTEGKGADTFTAFNKHLIEHKGKAEEIKDISCDMSPAFIKGAGDTFPEASITFDKFHVVKMLNEAVDKVRRAEQKEYPALKKTKFIWLTNPNNLTEKQRTKLIDIEKINQNLTQAYRIKLAFQDIFYQTKENAEESLKAWYLWAISSGLEPIIEFAKTVKNHWEGILRWFESKISNGILEGLNSLIQAAKAKARGYRTIKNLKTIIYLLVGKLKFDLPT